MNKFSLVLYSYSDLCGGRRKFNFTYRKNEEWKKYGQKQKHEMLLVSIPLIGISLPGQSALGVVDSLLVSVSTNIVIEG